MKKYSLAPYEFVKRPALAGRRDANGVARDAAALVSEDAFVEKGAGSISIGAN